MPDLYDGVRSFLGRDAPDLAVEHGPLLQLRQERIQNIVGFQALIGKYFYLRKNSDFKSLGL
jgi:hypothetical protein